MALIAVPFHTFLFIFLNAGSLDVTPGYEEVARFVDERSARLVDECANEVPG